MSGKYQGIFSLFHNLKKITEMMLYMIKMVTFFDENHQLFIYVKLCNLLNMVNKWSINVLSCLIVFIYIYPGKWGNYQGKIREFVSPN